MSQDKKFPPDAAEGVNEVERTDREHIFGTWAYQSEVSPTEVESADGVRFTTVDGDAYVDLSGQFMCSNLGHSADRIADAMAEQASDAAYVAPGYTTESRSRLGKLLAEVTPGHLSKTFFSTSGTEAVEAAIKIARFYTGKEKIVSRYRSYHGATYGCITVRPTAPSASPGTPVGSWPNPAFRAPSRPPTRTRTAPPWTRWRVSTTSTRCSNSRVTRSPPCSSNPSWDQTAFSSRRTSISHD